MASLLLLFQSERPFNAADLLVEAFVDLQALFDRIATVNDGRMIAVTDELSDTGCRHLGVFLSQIHRNLAHLETWRTCTYSRLRLLLMIWRCSTL